MFGPRTSEWRSGALEGLLIADWYQGSFLNAVWTSIVFLATSMEAKWRFFPARSKLNRHPVRPRLKLHHQTSGLPSWMQKTPNLRPKQKPYSTAAPIWCSVQKGLTPVSSIAASTKACSPSGAWSVRVPKTSQQRQGLR